MKQFMVGIITNNSMLVRLLLPAYPRRAKRLHYKVGTLTRVEVAGNDKDTRGLYYKHYGSIMYRLRSKLVCLSKPEEASLQQNLSFFHNLRIRNVS